MLLDILVAAAPWVPRIAILLIFGLLIPSIWIVSPGSSHWLHAFYTLFVLRYARFVGNMLGFLLYRRSAIRPEPTFRRSDVTVIVPTINPSGLYFEECILSILRQHVGSLIVVTVGHDLKEECTRILRDLVPDPHETSISVAAIGSAGKRKQLAHVLPTVSTPITILADDYVAWPDRMFIPSVIAPFEDALVGMVATKKRVRRLHAGEFSWASIVNFIAQNHIERQNWEFTCSSVIDGAVSVLSSRTAAYRTEFLTDTDLLEKFCNERFFFGKLGGKEGLQPDEDEFLTRKALEKGWLIKFQDTEAATVELSLGEWPKFDGQLARWARAPFRSNGAMLRNPGFLYRHTWSALMVYIPSLFNFAVVWDGALILTLVFALMAECPDSKFGAIAAGWLWLFLVWLFVSKVTKIMPALVRNLTDWPLVPLQIAFSYIHSVYKLWALLTFWNGDWSGRSLSRSDEETGQEGIPLDELATVEINV